MILIDFLGNGRSDRLDVFPEDLWIRQAGQVTALIEHLNIRNANLLGTSGGAWVAVNVALERPDLIRKVIADSFDGRTLDTDFARNLQEERSCKAGRLCKTVLRVVSRRRLGVCGRLEYRSAAPMCEEKAAVVHHGSARTQSPHSFYRKQKGYHVPKKHAAGIYQDEEACFRWQYFHVSRRGASGYGIECREICRAGSKFYGIKEAV